MRFAKPLTVGVLGTALLVVPFAGSSFAATDPDAPAQTHYMPQPEQVGQDLYANKVSIGTLGLGYATREVVPGEKYKIEVYAPNVKDDAVATLHAPRGKVYKLRLVKGKGTKFLVLPRDVKPGRYKFKVVVAGKTTIVEYVVVQRHDDDHARYDRASW
ncbi:hypothetical protein ACTMTI_28965 [Nonomuraea sp. H19]|uniref:hypothetical protein n=1 Tax=Nonomuraea sp. H19 TaxID=3452206 RepID=UPI003F890B49